MNCSKALRLRSGGAPESSGRDSSSNTNDENRAITPPLVSLAAVYSPFLLSSRPSSHPPAREVDWGTPPDPRPGGACLGQVTISSRGFLC